MRRRGAAEFDGVVGAHPLALTLSPAGGEGIAFTPPGRSRCRRLATRWLPGYFEFMKVGTKSLKNHLSLYLRRVRAGETVTVTDRGVPVAELRGIAPAADRLSEALRQLEDEGLVTVGTGRPKRFAAIRLGRGVRLSTAVLTDRG